MIRQGGFYQAQSLGVGSFADDSCLPLGLSRDYNGPRLGLSQQSDALFPAPGKRFDSQSLLFFGRGRRAFRRGPQGIRTVGATDAAIVPGEHDVIPSSDNPAATWDEAFGGTLHQQNWLGKVEGPLVRVGLQSPDLLGGAGLQMTSAFSRLWKKGDNCVIQKKAKSLLLTGKKEEKEMRFSLELPKEHEGDLLVSCTLRSLPPPNMPEHVARLLRVNLDESVGLYPKPGQGEEEPGIMAWAGKKPFNAVFYFRDVLKSKPVLHFVAESSVALEISDVTVHAAPDALARKFENGVVLCNPAHSEFTFDLAKLFPGMKLRRLQATSKQDVKTNNGKSAGKTVTLGPLDALFLLKE